MISNLIHKPYTIETIRDAYFTKDYKGEFDLRNCLLNPLYYPLEESTEEVRRRYEKGGYTKKITGIFAKDKNEEKKI